jgi:hypothetical protein
MSTGLAPSVLLDLAAVQRQEQRRTARDRAQAARARVSRPARRRRHR